MQMLIYRIKSECEGINMRREFLHNFFNPRINDALQRFRDVISKIQATSLEDYDFIVERTDRFYARKYSRMQQQLATTIQSSQEAHIMQETELKRQIQNGQEYAEQLQREITESEAKFSALCDSLKQEMETRIKEIKVNGRKEIEEYDNECEERNQRLESDSREYCRRLAEGHELMMARIKSETPQNAETPDDKKTQYLEKIKMLKNELFEARVAAKSLKNEFSASLKTKRQKLVQMEEESRKVTKIADDDVAAMEDKLNRCDERNKQIIQQLLNERAAKNAQYEAEICQKQSELDQLLAFQKLEYDRAKESANSEGLKNQAQTGQLEKSLSDNRQVILLSFERKEHEIEARLKELQSLLDSWCGDSQRVVLEQALDNTKKHNHSCREAALVEFKARIQKLEKEHEAQRKVFEDTMNSTKWKMDTDFERQNEELLNLEREKEEIMLSHASLLAQLAKDWDDEIEGEQARLDRLLKEKEDELNDEIKKLMKDRDDVLNERQLAHQRQCIDFKMKLQRENQEYLCSLERQGFSLAERNAIQEEYQRKFVELQENMETDTPCNQDRSIFLNMESAFNDLKRELADRKESIKTQRNMLNYEWRKAEKNENDRHSRKSVRRPQSRARDQVKQSLLMQLRTLREDTTEEENLRHQLQDLRGNALEREVGSKVRTASVTLGLDEDAKKLETELEELGEKSRREISDREKALRNELENSQRELRQRKADLDEQIEAISCSKKMYENLFNKEMDDLNKKLRELRGEFSESQKSLQMKHSVKLNNMMEIHGRNSSTLSKKCEEQRRLNDRNHAAMGEKLKARDKECADKLSAFDKKAQTELEKLRADRQVRMDLLAEMILNLEEKLNRAKAEPRFNPKVGRPEEIEAIERLQFTLHMKKIQLANAIRDLSQYRVMYVEQEDQINRKFSGPPDVGVMQVLQSRQPNPAIA